MLRSLFVIGILFLIDLYFFQLIKTLTIGLSLKWRTMVMLGYWSLTALAFLLILLNSSRTILPNDIRYYLFSVLLVLYIPKLIGILFLLGEDIFRSVQSVFQIFRSDSSMSLPSRRKFVSQTGLLVAAIPFATMIYGMVRTAFDLRIAKKTIAFDDLPAAFDGLTIVQISDLHCGSFHSGAFITEAVDTILALEPDLIFFTGDLVNNEASEAEPYISEFKRLTARYGVHSILGNHDYGEYIQWPSKEAKKANLERLKDVHRASGWNLLLNDHHILENEGENLALVGVENWGSSKHFPKYGDLDRSVSGAEHVPFKILLSHDPSHWDAKVRKHAQKFQLTLSGHTHGAQFGIEIPGFRWSPVQYIYKQWAGLYRRADQYIYVNRGLGFIGYMGRIGIRPEITFLQLRSNKNV